MGQEASSDSPVSFLDWMKTLDPNSSVLRVHTPRLPVLHDGDEEETELVEAPVLHCMGCRRRAPANASPFTLISSKHGWRVRRTPEVSGRAGLEWRCPKCWAAYKSLQMQR